MKKRYKMSDSTRNNLASISVFVFMIWVYFDLKSTKWEWGFNLDSLYTIFLWGIYLFVFAALLPGDDDIKCSKCGDINIDKRTEKSNIHFDKQTKGANPRPYRNIKPINNPMKWTEITHYICNGCGREWNKTINKSKILSEKEYNQEAFDQLV